MGASEMATESGMRRDLSVIHNAIQYFAADNEGEFPGAAKDDAIFKAELSLYLRTDFPENPVGVNDAKSDKVKFRNSGSPLVAYVGGDEGWLYDSESGEFIANCNDLSCDGVAKYSEF